MKNLENYGVQELTTVEQSKTEGGFWGALIVLAFFFGLWAGAVSAD